MSEASDKGGNPGENRGEYVSERGSAPELTEFISDPRLLVQRVLHVVASARSTLEGIGDQDAPNLIVGFEQYWTAMTRAVRRNIDGDSGQRLLKGRYITDVTPENLKSCVRIIEELGVDLRHLEGVKSNVILSDSEFVIDLSSPHPNAIATRVLYSNSNALLAQQKQLFETLWTTSIPGSQRIKEIVEGVEPETSRLLYDFEEMVRTRDRAISEVTNEVRMILASERAVHRSADAFRAIANRQAKVGFKWEIISPSISPETRRMFPGAEWRKGESKSVSITIYDKKRMFLVQYSDPEATKAEYAVTTNLYVTNGLAVEGFVSVFEALWREVALREAEVVSRRELERLLAMEEKSRRQVKLLQDILSHDVKNFNQAARLNAEVLAEVLQDELDPEKEDEATVAQLMAGIVRSIDGSTRLVDRAANLGRVISSEDVQLHPVDLLACVDKALLATKKAQPDKEIELKVLTHPMSARGPSVETISEEGVVNPILVMADGMLDDVFVNLFTNSAAFTEGTHVRIEVECELTTGTNPAMGDTVWKVSVIDHGRGISDDEKPEIFTRYLNSAHGSGLGLSLVHALVVNRYGGTITLRDTVPGDYSRGVAVELQLGRATARSS